MRWTIKIEIPQRLRDSDRRFLIRHCLATTAARTHGEWGKRVVHRALPLG